MPAEPVVAAEGLGKKYRLGQIRHDTLRDRIGAAWRAGSGAPPAAEREFWALKDISFEIGRGEVVGIIGRNGAGKSTLLKILARITDPTAGRAVIRGRVASLLEVGTGFHPELTGRENIFLNGAILGMKRGEIRARFDQITAFAEVERFLDTPVKHYSSGMHVRLAFAVAAHLEPEILIVDEVLAVGDIAFQKKCLGKMQAVSRQQGRTVLFVSHNLQAVRGLCGRSILLRDGRVEDIGATGRVIDRYVREFGELAAPRVPPPDADLTGSGYVTAVALETLEGRPQPVFRVGEPFRIRIRFTLGRAMRHFICGCGLQTAEGEAVQSAWSTPQSLPPGDHEALYVQDAVVLASGSYTLIVGLSEQERSLQQFEAMQFEISGENPIGFFPATSGVGMVLNSMRVELRRL